MLSYNGYFRKAGARKPVFRHNKAPRKPPVSAALGELMLEAMHVTLCAYDAKQKTRLRIGQRDTTAYRTTATANGMTSNMIVSFWKRTDKPMITNITLKKQNATADCR